MQATQEPMAAVGSGTMSASTANSSPTSVARLHRVGGPPTRENSFNAKGGAGDASSGGASSSLSIVFNASWVKLAAPIGEGAFSRVYEGVYRNPETQEESVVAVKILKKNMLKRRSDCLRFIKEAKIMTKISHSHIAACYGIGKYEDDDPHNPGSLFIVQELVRGGNLLHKVYKQMLNRSKCVYTSQEALNWMINVASGMSYLHAVTDTKPMIIHRDLKLENIMLAPEQSKVTAKLVDFGLHKVIDDRIKKVVKRVISEANLGGRLGRLRAQQAGEDELDVEDELEAALAEQQAIVMASSVKPGAAATASPLGTTTPVGRRLPARGASRLNIESSGPMSAMPEDDGKEEEAEARQKDAGPVSAVSAGEPGGQRVSGGSSKSPAAGSSVNEGGSAEMVPAIAKIRAPVKKQSSMQKLMAKMKEIKFRVTGNTKDSEPALVSSNLSRGESTSAAPDACPGGAQTTSNRSSSVSFSTTPTALTSSGVGGGGSVKFALPQPATEPSSAASALEDKRAKNVQLLDRIVAQQSVAEGSRNVMDDLGLMDGGAKKQRAPPRRAVTMINEIRYNLTEAVGSWAYMAPEVVLGQPYNEKVDVFSFGVILFEVLNRKLMLVDEIKNDPRKDAQAYAERVARGFRPEIPRFWPEALHELICACWAQDPHCRPNFAAVLDALHELDAEGVVTKLDVRFWSRGNAFI